jgi:hypothetical protein
MNQLIQDITILNKVYEEYKNQSIRTFEHYNIIFNKYKDKLHHIDRLNSIINYTKIIGKFYKYDELTGKLIIPIFYKKNKLYIYILFINVMLPDLALHCEKSYYYNSQITYGNIYSNHLINTFYYWSHHYQQYKYNYTQYKNENEFVKSRISDVGNEQDKLIHLKIYNTYEFQFISFKKQHELEFEKRLQKLELNNSELQKENNLLKNQVRQNEIEIHYLKSINKEKIVKYNYQEIKNRNKQLNQEFKRVYKLISKNIGFNLISN